MEQPNEATPGKRIRSHSGNNEGLPKKKSRKVGQFLFSSNLLDIARQKIGDQESEEDNNQVTLYQGSTNKGTFVLQQNEMAIIKQQFPDRSSFEISNLEQVREVTRKRNCKVKSFPPLEQDWIIFCKVATIANWRGHVRFFLIDEKGNEVKCQLEKEAACKGFRQILKIGKYYLVSNGVTSIDKESNLFISFYRNAKIIPTVKAFFKINASKTLQITQLYEKQLYSKVNVIGVIRIVKLCNDEKSEIGKIMNEVILCDPITLFQVQVKRLIIGPQQKTLSVGEVLIVHGFIIVERNQNTIGLASNQQSYHTVQQDTRDQIVFNYFQAVATLYWKTAKYNSIKKYQFSHRTLQTLMSIPLKEEKGPFYSVLDGHVIKILVGNPSIEAEEAQNTLKQVKLEEKEQKQVKTDPKVQQKEKTQQRNTIQSGEKAQKTDKAQEKEKTQEIIQTKPIIEKTQIVQAKTENVNTNSGTKDNSGSQKVQIGEIAKVVNTKKDEKNIYDLIVVFDDKTGRINIKMSWRMISSLVDITAEQYSKLCLKKTQLEKYLKKIKRNQVRLKIKSTISQQGDLEHEIQCIESLTRSLSDF